MTTAAMMIQGFLLLLAGFSLMVMVSVLYPVAAKVPHHPFELFFRYFAPSISRSENRDRVVASIPRITVRTGLHRPENPPEDPEQEEEREDRPDPAETKPTIRQPWSSRPR